MPRDSDIWSARSLEAEYHDKVVAVHRRFIEAGATMITTCNYGVQPHYYARKFGSESCTSRMAQDTKTAARLAVQGRSEAKWCHE